MNQCQTKPDGNRRKALRRSTVGCPHDDNQKKCGKDNFRHETRKQTVSAGRVHSVSVGSESVVHVKTGLSAGYQIQNTRSCDCAQDLSDRIRKQVRNGEPLANHQSRGDGRVQMAARDVSDGEGHGEDGQAESQSDPEETDSDCGKGCSQHGRAASAEYEPEGSEEFRDRTFAETHWCGPRIEIWLPQPVWILSFRRPRMLP